MTKDVFVLLILYSVKLLWEQETLVPIYNIKSRLKVIVSLLFQSEKIVLKIHFSMDSKRTVWYNVKTSLKITENQSYQI